MGRKHFGTGQCLLICFAGVILLFLTGCATFEGIKGKLAAREYMNRSSEFLADGNYEEAIEENQRVLSMSVEGASKDQAVFNIALIYAHYNNPEKDYKKSIEYFTVLINRFPKSPLIEQTKIWLDVLNVIEKAKQVDIDIEKKKKELEE